jgi:hypothetical protein
MTILEMLDALEHEIAGLRAERARLISALEDAERRLQTIREALGPPVEPAGAKPQRRKGTPSRRPSPAAAADGTTPERSGNHLGKRIALGRGMKQVRGSAGETNQTS